MKPREKKWIFTLERANGCCLRQNNQGGKSKLLPPLRR